MDTKQLKAKVNALQAELDALVKASGDTIGYHLVVMADNTEDVFERGMMNKGHILNMAAMMLNDEDFKSALKIVTLTSMLENIIGKGHTGGPDCPACKELEAAETAEKTGIKPTCRGTETRQ